MHVFNPRDDGGICLPSPGQDSIAVIAVLVIVVVLVSGNLPATASVALATAVAETVRWMARSATKG